MRVDPRHPHQIAFRDYTHGRATQVKRTLAGVSVGWIGLSMIADGVPALLLPHQLLARGEADATRLGLITLAGLGLAALVQPVAGSISDRLGRVPIILVGVAVAISGLALLLVPDALLAGALLALVGASVAQAGQQPLLPDLVPGAWRGRAAGLKGVFDVGGAFMGFALLGALLGGGQTLLAVAALAAVLIASFILAFALLGRLPAVRRPAAAGTTFDRRFVMLVGARFLFLLGIYVLGRFLVLFIADTQGVDADAAAAQGGVVLAVLTLATVAASPPAGWLADSIGRAPLVLGGGLLAAAGIALIPFASPDARLIGLGVLVAIGSAAFGAGTWAMLTDLAASPDAGRLLGLANWGTAGAAAAAGLAGMLIDLPGGGFQAAFLLAAGLAALGGLLGWRICRNMEVAAAPAQVPA